jgi:serine/threonine protein phosphatase PrpC
MFYDLPQRLTGHAGHDAFSASESVCTAFDGVGQTEAPGGELARNLALYSLDMEPADFFLHRDGNRTISVDGSLGLLMRTFARVHKRLAHKQQSNVKYKICARVGAATCAVAAVVGNTLSVTTVGDARAIVLVAYSKPKRVEIVHDSYPSGGPGPVHNDPRFHLLSDGSVDVNYAGQPCPLTADLRGSVEDGLRKIRTSAVTKEFRLDEDKFRGASGIFVAVSSDGAMGKLRSDEIRERFTNHGRSGDAMLRAAIEIVSLEASKASHFDAATRTVLHKHDDVTLVISRVQPAGVKLDLPLGQIDKRERLNVERHRGATQPVPTPGPVLQRTFDLRPAN